MRITTTAICGSDLHLYEVLGPFIGEGDAVSVGWEMIAQAAQAAKDGELLALAQQRRPDTLRWMRWANAQIKQLSPQILLS